MKEYINLNNAKLSGDIISCDNCELETNEKALKITTKEGMTVSFNGKNGNFDRVQFCKDKILVIPILYNENHSICFRLEFYENADSDEFADIKMGVMPGFLVNLEFPLIGTELGTLFIERTPGRYKNTSIGTPAKAEKINKFNIRIPPSNAIETIYIGQPYLTDKSPVHHIPKIPFLDKLGQWNMKEWKGKTKDENELKDNLLKWADEDLPSVFKNEKYSKYGGYKQKNFGRSGFFRIHNENGMWHLVDPDGYMFFSTGINCVHPGSGGPVNNIECLFEELPLREGIYKDAWSISSDNASICFYKKNMISVFGESWHEEWRKLTAKRLRSWGFNTVANWSEKGFGKNNNIPYVIQMVFPKTKINIFRDFPDVFSEEYKINSEKSAEYLHEFKDNNLLIGYFMRNEPTWAFGDYNIALLMIESDIQTHTRTAFIEFIKKEYKNDINKFNKAWHTDFYNFEMLNKPFNKKLLKKAEDDTKEFTKKMIYKYVQVPALEYKKVDTNHLNLGMRWAGLDSDSFMQGSEFIDVFSINCYKKVPSADEIAKITKKTGKPVIIGEYHSGAIDAGLPSNGLQGVANQQERGRFYSYYLENAATIPSLIGCHYFQYNDQIATGRFDGEALNVGFVDVCGKPYFDKLPPVIDTNKHIYEIRTEKKAPTTRKAVSAYREGFA